MTETTSAAHTASSHVSPNLGATMTRIDWHRTAAQTVVLGFASGALYFSFDHITHLAASFGATSSEAHAAPFYIDGIMLLGRMAMAKRFTARTNRLGRRFMIGGAVASLAANIGAGATIGSRAFGALIVAGFLLCEYLAGQFTTRAAARPAAQSTPPAKPAAKATPKTKATARKCLVGCTCGKHDRKARQQHPVAVIQALPANAPVSPAPYGGLIVARNLDEATA
jgi:hypothetical protein